MERRKAGRKREWEEEGQGEGRAWRRCFALNMTRSVDGDHDPVPWTLTIRGRDHGPLTFLFLRRFRNGQEMKRPKQGQDRVM